MNVLTDNAGLLFSGFLKTLQLSVVAGVGALIIGTLLAGFRVSPIPPLRAAATFYVEVLRNTPLTAVFFLVVFGLPQLDLTFQNFSYAAMLALTLYTAAFVCEVVRSGINSVSMGQAEAARALGLTFRQSLREVILPQAFRTVVPPLGNVWIALVKNSSIAAGFAVTELTALVGRLANTNASQVLVIFGGVAAAYMVITVPSAIGVNYLERRVAILR